MIVALPLGFLYSSFSSLLKGFHILGNEGRFYWLIAGIGELRVDYHVPFTLFVGLEHGERHPIYLVLVYKLLVFGEELGFALVKVFRHGLLVIYYIISGM